MKVIGKVNTSAKTRSFSDVTKNADLMKKIMVSSRSASDAQSRLQAYTMAQSNLMGLANLKSKKFSSTGLGDLAGLSPDQFIDVTVTTMIKSLAGFLSVERGMDAPSAKLPFVNILNISDDSIVSPNIGPDTHLQSSKIVYKEVAPVGTGISFSAATPLVSGTLAIYIKKGGNNFKVIDDSQGALLAPATLGMTVGTIDYSLGSIAITLGSAFAPGDNYTIEVIKDAPKTPVNKVKGSLGFFDMITAPEVIIAENNLITNLVAQKSMGVDMAKVLKRRITEEYVKLVNDSVTNPIVNQYTGNSVDLDIASYSPQYDNFESYLRLFGHGLNQVDTQLTAKSFKSVNSSAYLVGSNVADVFKSMTTVGNFVRNEASTYIDDLVGYYNNIPVVKSVNVDANTGYAIHKTSDGSMAPVARGIFLPVNDLPEVGNFNNPTQSASGIYSYEGTRLLTSDLIQKFTVTMPTGFNML